MATILIIEDDMNIRKSLTDLLNNNGYRCITLNHFHNLLNDILQIDCDLILLDILLPNYDGKYICKEIRKELNIPIIMVTSQNSQLEELTSIHYGADDFITKPYHPQILLARIEAVLKRYQQIEAPTILTYQNLELDISKSILKVNNIELELSKNEMQILYFLIKNQGKIISREELMNYLWNTEQFISDNTLTVNMNRLRKKLEELGLTDIIVTKRGQGYIIL